LERLEQSPARRAAIRPDGDARRQRARPRRAPGVLARDRAREADRAARLADDGAGRQRMVPPAVAAAPGRPSRGDNSATTIPAESMNTRRCCG
jgi:hypothetical protein